MSSRSNIPKVKADDPDVATIQHFWEHLDDLAKSNPDEYKKFIKSQMDELKTERDATTFLPIPYQTLVSTVMKKSTPPPPPQPGMNYNVPSTTFSVSAGRLNCSLSLLFVTLCHHPEVGPPQLKRGPEGKPAPYNSPVSALAIPLSIGPQVNLDKNVPLPPKKPMIFDESSLADQTIDTLLSSVATHETVKSTTDKAIRAFIIRTLKGALTSHNRGRGNTPSQPLLPLGDVEINRYGVDVSFHPDVIKRSKEDIEMSLAVAQLALYHVEEDFHINFSRPYETLEPIQGTDRPRHLKKEALEAVRGDLDGINRLLSGDAPPTNDGDREGEGNSGKLKVSSDTKPGIDIVIPSSGGKGSKDKAANARIDVSTLRILDTNEAKANGSGESAAESGLDIRPFGSTPKTNHEGEETGKIVGGTMKKLVDVVKRVPVYKVTSKDGNICLTFEMPEDASAASLIVDIGDSQWSIETDNYKAMGRFPSLVESSTAVAKFSKKRRELTITATKRPS